MTFWKDILPMGLRILLVILFPFLVLSMILVPGCSPNNWVQASAGVDKDVVTVYAIDSTVIVVRYKDVSEPIILTKDDVLSLRRKVP